MAALSVTAANVAMGPLGLAKRYLAKGTITRGMPVYYSTSLGGVVAAGSTGLGGAAVLGIALEDVGTGQYCLVCVEDPSFTPGATIVAGDTIWVHTTAGSITKTAADVASGDTNVVLGIGLTTTTMYLRPLTGAAVP